MTNVRPNRKNECPSPEVLERVADGADSGEEADLVAEHLNSCRECRELFNAALPMTHQIEELKAARPKAGERQQERDAINTVLSPLKAARDHVSGEVVLGSGLRLAPPREPRFLARLGAFDIVSVLGQGGMGVVFKAYEPALSRDVALKIMGSELLCDDVARKRFLREARSAARLNHPNVVTIFSVGEEQSIPYIAMEYVKGSSLAATLSEEGQIEPGRAATIAMGILAALGCAHERGIIHRDVKPSNILLEEGTGRARLVDFGLARGVTDDVRYTKVGVATGTPSYMSPEQARGAYEFDARSDLFSAGSVLFEMVAGVRPFVGGDAHEILRKIREEEAPDVRDLQPLVPGRLAAVIQKAMQKEPAKRYQSAEEFAEDVAPFVDGGAAPAGKPEVAASAALVADGIGTLDRCGACSNVIVSRLSVGGQCGVCGAPICERCWKARSVRVCAEHAAKGHDTRKREQPSPAPGRARCEEQLPDAQAAERVRHQPDDTGPRIKPIGPDKGAEAEERPEPQPAPGPDAVTAERARVAEETFLRLVENSVASLPAARDPLSGADIQVKNWHRLARRSSREADLRHALGLEEEAETPAAYPLGATLTFEVKKPGLVGRKACVVIEGHYLVRVEQFCRTGYDEEPINKMELEVFLNATARRAAEAQEWHLVILGNPVGWTEEARDFAVEPGTRAFHDRFVSVVLLDEGSAAFLYDKSDERLASYKEALFQRLDPSLVEKARGFVRSHLELNEAVSLDTFEEKMGLSRTMALRVFKRLAKTGDFKVEALDGVGTVLFKAPDG